MAKHETPALPRILLVDDEPAILEGLQFQLRKRFDVFTAANGLQGLAQIGSSAPFAVVLSDMRMPRMDGAEFLTRVRQAAPDTVRVLLTGQADIHSAIALDFDALITRGLSPQACLDTLRGHAGRYDKTVLQALAHCRGNDTDSQEIQEVQIQAVREGMVFAEDVHTHTGTLLVPRGYQVSASFMAHVKAFKRGYVQETVAVIVSNPDANRSANDA